MTSCQSRSLRTFLVECLEERRLLSAMPSPGNAEGGAGHVGRHESPGPPIVPQLVAQAPLVASTVPANGDVNPYGVAIVPHRFPKGGTIHSGDVLVSNFNSASNLQGTGTTIVDIAPSGKQTLFFQGAAGLGLSTAIAVLHNGYVIVGNVPTTDGTAATAKAGSLIVLDRNGKVVMTLADAKLLDGPWDMTVRDRGPFAQLFVSNVLSGTITRIDLKTARHSSAVHVLSERQIASGFAHRGDPNALLLGPTGLAYDRRHDTLYVASTADNSVFSVADAGRRQTDAGKGGLVYKDDQHLRGPLGLVQAPNGDLIATNGDAVNGDPAHPSEIVEFTPAGKFVAQTPVDASGQGGAFGIALASGDDLVTFAAVDDVTNTLHVWKVK